MLAPPAQAAAAPLKPNTQNTPGKADGSLLINMANAAAEEVILLKVKEVSVSIPQRKKYDLCFTKNYLYTMQVGTSTPVQGMVYKWDEIGMSFALPLPLPPTHFVKIQHDLHICSEYVFYTPIPEKQQVQHNYTLFPRSTALSATKSFPPVDFEPFLFTVPPTAPKPGVVEGYAAATAAQVSDSYTSLMHWAITSQLQAVGNTGVTITAPDPRVFYSTAKQSYRPNERAVHVRAHRGTKDGFLFFLPNGILWGYKKPLLFIPLDRIVAVSYTNVLQRTFDITIEVDVSHDLQQQQPEGEQDGGVKTEEIEFSMIDHEDYGVIDDSYIQRHGLNNRSMAEGRRAKRQLRESGARQANGDVMAAADPEDAVLARAEEMMEQDEEDEEEEDYDPGSEGESEGEGSSSEEDSDEEGDDDGDEEDDDGLEDEDGLEEGEGDEMEMEGGAHDHQ